MNIITNYMRHRGQVWVRWVGVLAVIGVIAAGGAVIALRVLRPMVSVTHVVEGPVVQAFDQATGTLTPDREYPIRSNVGGIVVEV